MPSETGYPLSEAAIASYRRDGFVRLRGVFRGERLRRLQMAVEAAVAAETDADWMGVAGRRSAMPAAYQRLYTQRVDLWRRHSDVAAFTLGARLGDIAARLEGRPMRLWHDQALFKQPDGGAANPTPWHQDNPYWPIAPADHQTTAWIALRPTDPRNGCLAFLAGSQHLGEKPPVNLSDPIDVFAAFPDLDRASAKPCPLEAGDCTFHNSLTFHFAGSNRSPGPREGYAVIFMADGARFTGLRHPVTEAMNPGVGQPFGDDHPLVGRP